MKTNKMTNLQVEAYIKNAQWWEEKNEDKERSLEYDLDFEHEIVEHIYFGDTIQPTGVTDDS